MRYRWSKKVRKVRQPYSEHMFVTKATSAANHASVLSLLEQGYSVRDIERRTGLGKSTVGRTKKRWIQTRKTILVDVLPSFLLMTKHLLFVKFNQGSWILLFRPLISSILLFSILSTPKQSEGHFRRAVSGLLQRKSAYVEEGSSSEEAGVCTRTWKLVSRGLEKRLVVRWNKYKQDWTR